MRDELEAQVTSQLANASTFAVLPNLPFLASNRLCNHLIVMRQTIVYEYIKKCMLHRSRNMTFFRAPSNTTDSERHLKQFRWSFFTQCACILQLSGDSCNLSDDSGLGEDNLGDGGNLLDNLDGSLDDLAELELLVSFVGKRETARLVHCDSDLMCDRNML